MAMRAATTGDTDTVDIYATGPWIRVGNRVLIGLVCGLALFSLVSISGAVG